jgi:hypothetical protein
LRFRRGAKAIDVLGAPGLPEDLGNAVGSQADVDRQAAHVDVAGDLHRDRVDFDHDPPYSVLASR